MGCVLFINNFEHYFLQGSLVLNKKLMKKYCKLVSLLSILVWVTECKVSNWKWHSAFVITNPLTVKQISFCLYSFYMNDCISMYKHMSSHIFCMIIIFFLIQNVKILSVFTNLLQSGATCRETPFLSCDPPPSNYFCLIQMLCHRCYLGANFWVNVFTLNYISMVI